MIFIIKVLSKTVSKAMKLTGGKEAYETAYFIEKIDKFFNSLNVSSYTAGKGTENHFSSHIEVVMILGYL